ncbi:MAG: hypothetical protein L6R45_34990 [Anaerolineae bacterium]|nr:hypothetical protein [Anaerolineae bacterium]
MDTNDLADWANIISLPVAIISIVVSILLVKKGKPKKSLTYEVISSKTEPIQIDAGIKSDIIISYKGEPVENLYIIDGKIKNTGAESIREDKGDVVGPITFPFPRESKLVVKPEDIVIKVQPPERIVEGKPNKTGSGVSLEFKLLNPGDEIFVRFIYTGEYYEPEPYANIDNIYKINQIDLEEKRLEEKVRGYATTILMAGVLYLSCYGILMGGQLVKNILPDATEILLGKIFGGLLILFFLVGFFWVYIKPPISDVWNWWFKYRSKRKG